MLLHLWLIFEQKDWLLISYLIHLALKLCKIVVFRIVFFLIDTDYLANSDVTMPDYIKTWRQTLRDLPANHTDEDAYDLLLARDSDGKLTHSVWTQPTS
mgnify:CR=1 FL=1